MNKFLSLIFSGLFTFAIVFSVQGRAAVAKNMSDLEVHCTTPWPTVSLKGSTADGVFSLDIQFHDGVMGIPVYTGTVTPQDVKMVQEDADALTKLGDHWVFSWNLRDCSAYQEGTISCPFHTQVMTGVQRIEQVTFNTQYISQRSFGNVLEKIQIPLWLVTDGRMRQVMFEYEAKDCQIRFSEAPMASAAAPVPGPAASP